MLQFLRQILCERATATRLDHPGTDTLSKDGTPRVDVSLRQSKQLTDRHNTIPEEVAAHWIAHALAHANFGYRITYGYAPVDTPTEQAVCGESDAADYFEDHITDPAQDANLLLTDATGGGCARAWSHPRVASVGARNLSERRTWTAEGTDDFHAAIQSVLHELGHCLGAHHDHDEAQPGNQSPGVGWNDDEREVWVYTPTMFNSAGTVNMCGEDIPTHEYETGMRRHEYSECAVDLFREELSNRNPMNEP